MVAIKVYDIETGHVQTVAVVPTVDIAHTWMEQFRAGGAGTNDVVYTAEAGT